MCGTHNWPKHKTCWTCKIQRSYADVVAQQPAPRPHVNPRVPNPGQSLQQQLACITKQIGQARLKLRWELQDAGDEELQVAHYGLLGLPRNSVRTLQLVYKFCELVCPLENNQWGVEETVSLW